MRRYRLFLGLAIAVLLLLSLLVSVRKGQNSEDPKLTEVWKPVPAFVATEQDKRPPSDAVVLFDRGNLTQWTHGDGSPAKWTVNENSFTVAGGTGSIQTKRAFGDCQLHLEWCTPSTIKEKGQGRGNSGVFLQSRYEVQILDSYNNRTYSNGQAASIYKQYAPLVNASRKPGEWQTYDIIYNAPHFDKEGNVLKPAYVTVIHNGILVQNHVEIKGKTTYSGKPVYRKHNLKEPLILQDHGSPVSFRNIWIREL